MITTGAMIQIGKTLGNRMIDFTPVNEKLRIRARRALRELAGIDDGRAVELMAASGGRLKVALVAALTGKGPEEAEALLTAHGGRVRRVVAELERNGGIRS
jgi:N-acetylmuramic acid 6-phosphate etherase